MAISIRCNNDIKGIQIGPDETQVKIIQFADDTTLISDGSRNSILSAIKVAKKLALLFLV